MNGLGDVQCVIFKCWKLNLSDGRMDMEQTGVVARTQ